MPNLQLIPRGKEIGRSHTEAGIYGAKYDDVPELQEAEAYLTYSKMRRSDPTVSAAMQSVELPIRQGTYDVQPPNDPTKKEERQANVLREALLEHLPWHNVLRSAVTCFTHGFSIFEIVLEYRNKLMLPKKLSFRPQHSMLERDGDRNSKGELVQLTQYLFGREVKIPRRKLLICSVDAESTEMWRGQSLLRPAYKPWYLKEKMEIINAISHERWAAGVPVLTTPEGVETDSIQWEHSLEQLKKVHSGASSYAALPFGYDLHILDRRASFADPLHFIRELKDDIKTAVLALHLRLGGGDTSGSKALGVAFVDSFLHAVQSWADLVCSAINYDLIRPLVDMNWGTPKRYPTLTVTNIYKTALQELAYLIQVGAITPTPELIRYIFEQYGIRIDPTTVASANMNTNTNTNMNTNTDTNATDDTTSDTEKEEDAT